MNDRQVGTTADVLKKRTKFFGLEVIRLIDMLPRTETASVLGRQLLRSATSLGANYRAACRARSRAEFISKIGVVEEEADESAYWLEMLQEARVMSPSAMGRLLKEAEELTAIFTASRKTARQRER